MPALDIQIDGSLFRVSRRLLRRDSVFFEEILRTEYTLAQPGLGESDARPLQLKGVSESEMRSFLAFLYAS